VTRQAAFGHVSRSPLLGRVTARVTDAIGGAGGGGRLSVRRKPDRLGRSLERRGAAHGQAGLGHVSRGLDGLVAGQTVLIGRRGGLADRLVVPGVGALDLRADQVAQRDVHPPGGKAATAFVATVRKVRTFLNWL